MTELILPSLKGKFGNWIYFIATMKLSDVADVNRVSTVSEIEELYTKNINNVLQRELDRKRINKISEYLQHQKERFLNSIIVAIYKGNPTWSELQIEDNFKIQNKVVEDQKLSYARGRLGFMTLLGNETMFVLDGQHRIKGIREAYKKNPDLVGGDDITVTFVVHDTKLKERTRRLFTVLNKYAEKPKKAELIIMEEDDPAAILTRKLLLEHPFFKKENAISTTRDLAIPSTDFTSFSTLVCLYKIHQILIDFSKRYPTSKLMKRPSNTELGEMYEDQIVPFWDFVLKKFPQLDKFIDGKSADKKFNRNKENGGSLLLRPEGQLLLATLYKHFLNKGSSQFSKFKTKVTQLDWNLSNPLWKYVFWIGDKMNTKDKSLKSQLLLFLFGEKTINKDKLKVALDELYDDYNAKFKGKLTPL